VLFIGDMGERHHTRGRNRAVLQSRGVHQVPHPWGDDLAYRTPANRPGMPSGPACRTHWASNAHPSLGARCWKASEGTRRSLRTRDTARDTAEEMERGFSTAPRRHAGRQCPLVRSLHAMETCRQDMGCSEDCQEHAGPAKPVECTIDKAQGYGTAGAFAPPGAPFGAQEALSAATSE